MIDRSCSIASLFFLKISLFPGKKQGLTVSPDPDPSRRQHEGTAEVHKHSLRLPDPLRHPYTGPFGQTRASSHSPALVSSVKIGFWRFAVMADISLERKDKFEAARVTSKIILGFGPAFYRREAEFGLVAAQATPNFTLY